MLVLAPCQATVLDDLRQPKAWQASASDQVRASLRADRDGSLCLDYDFNGVSGYAVMRRELPVTWPAQFELTLRLKQTGARNPVQIKWVDDSGDNVWWSRPAAERVPSRLGVLSLRRRHVDFAWGPATERRLQQTRFAELVVVAEQGGRGSLCVARIGLQPREPDPETWPAPVATRDAQHWTLDFGHRREFNGLALRWPVGAAALRYALQASDDGRRWRTLRTVDSAGRGLDALFLPESQARWLRLALPRSAPEPTLQLQDAAAWPDLNAVVATRAAVLPRGDVPRAWHREQNHWTLVGVDGGGPRSALLSEDGAIEIGRGGFSIEPSVQLEDGARVTWAEAAIGTRLPDAHLPLPLVQWSHPAFALDVQAAADGPATAPELLARYTLRNTSGRTQRYTLALALRPWQVNPPQQFLSTPGGASPVSQLAWDGARQLLVNGHQHLHFTAPAQATASPFDRGLSLVDLAEAPPLAHLVDPQRHASGLWRWRFTLPAGQSQMLGFVAPLGAGSAAEVDAAALQARFDAVARVWRLRLGRIELQGPPEVQGLSDTLRSSLVHLLISRDGPALQPGTRSYARTWVRDGAMMVAALVRLGEVAVARDFVDWYAGHLFASGKVPCCVDHRGSDPVVENDSHGQFLYAVAEVHRASGDAAWLRRHWDAVQRVTHWMEALRQGERGERNRAPERAHLFGLMPPSISHEGYADKPAYSLWDDFWALRGYKDAVGIAAALGKPAEAERWAAWRDEFQRELRAAIARSQQHHGIDFIPGAADRGDFDGTSTTIALDPAHAELALPPLQATFERYWRNAESRRSGQRPWADYTPYEWRSVGALVRLGQVARAHAMIDFFFQHQRPAGWNQWAEVVLPNARQPRFLGDMPHAWVSSDFIRSTLDLFAYDDEVRGRIVLGAGWPAAWLNQPRLVARGLHLAQGPLDLQLDRTDAGWQLQLPQARPGSTRQLVLRWPDGIALPRALHDGRELVWQHRELLLPPPPVRVDLLRP